MSKSAPPDATPMGRLSEASLHLVLGYQLAQATIVTNAVFAQQVGEPFELRPVEYTVLTLVHENPDVSATRLAKALAVSAPNIAAWVDRLETRGLVRRSPHATDRRAQHLRVTAEGARLANRATRAVLDGEAGALGALSKGERMILIELLHKVAGKRGA
ncbi:MarR family winged helix-turn-helix transcriptional regulator [Variovorax saccharolyticus]|uniref:MarR family winged helix-turn-helix transcriptional regulator n=1 Tax=Variovorax saccharolyticus TaxID=3053516 RepID=UPI002575327E|nr:MarR family transcriptional regulator [Variovorax sp. J22R187]MDM0021964.1 MarR family transcriptional regulator [Variovorax sp. J22R187]